MGRGICRNRWLMDGMASHVAILMEMHQQLPQQHAPQHNSHEGGIGWEGLEALPRQPCKKAILNILGQTLDHHGVAIAHDCYGRTAISRDGSHAEDRVGWEAGVVMEVAVHDDPLAPDHNPTDRGSVMKPAAGRGQRGCESEPGLAELPWRTCPPAA